MAAAGDFQGVFHRTLSVLRRPISGPFLFGFVFGGIPFGIMFSRLGGTVISANLLGRILQLTPAAVVVATIGAVLSVNSSWGHILGRASLASLGACVPVPTIICTALAWHWGYEAFSAENLPFLVGIFIGWAVAVTIPSWLLALTYTIFRRRTRSENR
jgi:hypothetical protein